MTSIHPDMPPTLKRKFALIEAQYGRPVWDVVADMARQGMTRSAAAEALRYCQSNFLKLLKSKWAPRGLQWRYSARGEAQHVAKLTPEDVRLIRQLRPNTTRRPGDLTYHEIAEKFGVRYSTVHAVVRYDTWRHV